MIPRLVTFPDGTVGLTFDEPSAPCPSYYVFPDDAAAIRARELAIEAADRATIAAARGVQVVPTSEDINGYALAFATPPGLTYWFMTLDDRATAAMLIADAIRRITSQKEPAQ